MLHLLPRSLFYYLYFFFLALISGHRRPTDLFRKRRRGRDVAAGFTSWKGRRWPQMSALFSFYLVLLIFI